MNTVEEMKTLDAILAEPNRKALGRLVTANYLILTWYPANSAHRLRLTEYVNVKTKLLTGGSADAKRKT